jgi:hypothetical protein
VPTDHTPASPTTQSNENGHPSLDVLHDLWEARWGNDWVPVELVADDAFFREAYNVMKKAGEIETHFLTDRARYVCKRI